MQVVANTGPAAPSNRKPGATVGVATENGWYFVSLDQWLLGPSEVMVLANREAVQGGQRGVVGKCTG